MGILYIKKKIMSSSNSKYIKNIVKVSKLLKEIRQEREKIHNQIMLEELRCIHSLLAGVRSARKERETRMEQLEFFCTAQRCMKNLVSVRKAREARDNAMNSRFVEAVVCEERSAYLENKEEVRKQMLKAFRREFQAQKRAFSKRADEVGEHALENTLAGYCMMKEGAMDKLIKSLAGCREGTEVAIFLFIDALRDQRFTRREFMENFF